MALKDIDTFVIVIMENRSFDHMLGYLSLDGPGQMPVDGLRSDAAWRAAHANLWKGKPVEPRVFEQPSGAMKDPPHDSASVHTQIEVLNVGKEKMGGFVQAYDAAHETGPDDDPDWPTLAMGYQEQGAVGTYDFLAHEFAVCDHWFAALPSSTQPNRLMAMSGESKLSETHSGILPDQDLVYDWLKAQKVSWRVYIWGKFVPFFFLMKRWMKEVLASLVLPGNPANRRFRYYDPNFKKHWQAAGPLPPVIFIEPEYTSAQSPGTPTDDHPPTPVANGQAMVLEIYKTLISNPARWARTMLIVTYDEHGGFFDHAPPLPISQQTPDKLFETSGVRVPALIVSPQVDRGAVFSKPLDHTSILQMLADRFTTTGRYSPSVDARQQGLGRLSEILTVPPAASPRAPAAPVMLGAALSAQRTFAVAVRRAPPPPNDLERAFKAAIAEAEQDNPSLHGEPKWQGIKSKVR